MEARQVSDQYSEAGRRSHYDDGPRASSLARQQQHEYPPIGASRQNVFSSVLDAGRNPAMPPFDPNSGHNRDTFVQMESPAETMTKAFTPQGLLSAGLHDKEGRSAKRQEELARESGASLINVPNKPPPPQTGLLGAISAHERERNREGGMGAALTEREREKRSAEDRQRKLDDFQRQQLEQHQQMAQAGPMFGGMFPGGGLTPQMTGMNNPYFNPQMMGAGHPSMYFNPMMNPMMNPQHMFAAQQAAQAYQQAMIAMSAAGSQVGGDRGSPGAAGGAGGSGGSPPPAGSAMGMGMGGVDGMMPNMAFDPRMSMFGMPGMMSPMGMGGMGMNPSMMPMGMQATGGSSPAFDPRFSMAGGGQFDAAYGNGGIGSTGNFGMMGQPMQQPPSRGSQFNSPAGSPAPRIGGAGPGAGEQGVGLEQPQPLRTDNASPRS